MALGPEDPLNWETPGRLDVGLGTWLVTDKAHRVRGDVGCVIVTDMTIVAIEDNHIENTCLGFGEAKSSIQWCVFLCFPGSEWLVLFKGPSFFQRTWQGT